MIISKKLIYGYRISKYLLVINWQCSRNSNNYGYKLVNSRKTFVYSFIGIIGIFAQCVLMISFAHIPIANLEWYHKTGIYGIFILPIFVNGFVECQYVIYTTMLKTRYEILNEYLSKMIENNYNNNNNDNVIINEKNEGK